jgi:hypothetical protein
LRTVRVSSGRPYPRYSAHIAACHHPVVIPVEKRTAPKNALTPEMAQAR